MINLFVLAGCGSDEENAAESPAIPAIAPTVIPVPQESPTETPVKAEPEVAKPEAIQIKVDMHDSYYGDSDTNMTDPPVWTVSKGAVLLIELINHGHENHNWAIVKAGAEVPVPYTEGALSDILLVEPGMIYANSQTMWTIYAPAEPGEYEIICTVEGHYPFMRGKLIVTD